MKLRHSLCGLVALAFSASATAAAEGEALVKKHQCIACHAIKDMELRIGPPFPVVALRYQKADEATLQRLADKIIHGGAGAWGTVPMVTHPQLTQSEAEQMVRWVLQQAPAVTEQPARKPTSKK